jgi:hypothetical protein
MAAATGHNRNGFHEHSPMRKENDDGQREDSLRRVRMERNLQQEVLHGRINHDPLSRVYTRCFTQGSGPKARTAESSSGVTATRRGSADAPPPPRINEFRKQGDQMTRKSPHRRLVKGQELSFLWSSDEFPLRHPEDQHTITFKKGVSHAR